MHHKSQANETLKELVADSTIHGLPRIIKSKHILMKIIWSICFLACACYCSYLMVDMICDFLNFDYVTTIDTVYETPAKFPAVTICSTNPFQNNQADAILDDFNQNFKLEPNLSSSLKLYFLMRNISNQNESFKKSIGNPLEEILINCEFGTLKCTADDFEWMFHYMLGNCYRFNSGKDSRHQPTILKNISMPGTFYGLRLELYNEETYKTQDLIKYNGIHVMIDNQTSNVNYAEGFNISPGTSTNVVVNRFYNYKLGEPYTNCKPNLTTADAYDSDLYRAMFRFNLTYNQKDCFYFCYQKKVVEKCKCYLNAYERLNCETLCTNKEQTTCTQKVWLEFLHNDYYSDCLPYCPAECQSFRYSLTISDIDYPKKSYFDYYLVNNSIIKAKYSNREINYEDLKRKISSLVIYYETMTYTVTSQIPKWDIFGLASNVGGLLGLFLGVSFLSIVELVEALFEILYINCRANSRVTEILVK